ncbi:(2Fe-2S)-binding protein [Micromonospora sp. NPDC048830]|uniref:(2Fe-2S)-binding protein n=1 Tax=Micromonospora sp. NPDC048830 TaxID=3364257 RepID=UPI00371485C2
MTDQSAPVSTVSMTINGTRQTFVCEDRRLLVHAIRDNLDLKGTRVGCMNGDCGTCTIKLDGQAVKSCLILAASANGAEITTIEGIAPPGELSPLQKAMWEEDAFQCGFCVAGTLFAAQELLDTHDDPDEDDIRKALIGNLCRCTGYEYMVKAVRSVARARRPGGTSASNAD